MKTRERLNGRGIGFLQAYNMVLSIAGKLSKLRYVVRAGQCFGSHLFTNVSTCTIKLADEQGINDECGVGISTVIYTSGDGHLKVR